RLFGSRGGPSYCWCMAWRAASAELRQASGAKRREQMASRVRAGTPVGLLGYVDGAPVAWCSIAPRSTFRRLVSDGGSDGGVWSITCFFVSRPYRKTRLAPEMLAEAVRHAKRRGAKVVEGYPVDPGSPSYRHMGFVPMFARAGFVECGREGSRRHVMRLALDRARAAR